VRGLSGASVLGLSRASVPVVLRAGSFVHLVTRRQVFSQYLVTCGLQCLAM